MSLSDDNLSYILDNLAQLEKVYEDVENTYIPATLKQARETAWELSVGQFDIDGLGYSADDRKADGQRLVRLHDAQKMLSQLEDALVRNFVTQPQNSLLNFVYGVKDFIPNAVSAVLNLLQTLWNSGNFLPLAWQIGLKFWDKAFDAIGVTELAKTVLTGVQLRDGLITQLRKKALPQRNATRHVRAKMSRA